LDKKNEIMIQKELRQHQWKAFRRNPMFERNLTVKIFMGILFGYLALEFLVLGFFLDKILLKAGIYNLAIAVFNSILLYIFAADFTIKFFLKQNQSMQIAPYLTLPIKRKSLFNFLLKKEFSSFWNLYFLFLVVPFAFKSITPYFGFVAAVLYILFFYLACIGISLIVSLINSLINKSSWYYIPTVLVVAIPFFFQFVLKINLGGYTQHFGDWLLNYNPLAWVGFILFLVILWGINRRNMREIVYRDLQGEKASKISSFSSLSFLDRFGEMGEFINLELRLITRAKRLKSSFYSVIFLFIYFFWQIYSDGDAFKISIFPSLFFGMFLVAYMGLIMGQYLFMAESSYFDGLMSRKLSILNLLKAKYLLYSAYSVIAALLMLIPVFSGKLDLLFVISMLFFVIGPIYFLIFQNAVYNKMHFDLFEGGMMNWKGTSPSMMFISLTTMFAPVILLLILSIIFGKEVTYWFMLVVGLGFTFTNRYWMEWTYKRFLKRKHKNMEGFRSNA
jgi:hypothetical protein